MPSCSCWRCTSSSFRLSPSSSAEADMAEACGLCGGQLDDHAVRVTVTFAPGLRNGNHFLELPFRLKDWPICWKCFTGEGCKVLRSALADEYIEPVMPHSEACRTVCAGHLRRK